MYKARGIRLSFVADGAVTYAEDFTEYIRGDFNFDDLQDLIKGIMPGDQ